MKHYAWLLLGLLVAVPAAWADRTSNLPQGSGTFETTVVDCSANNSTSNSIGTFIAGQKLYGFSVIAKVAGGGITLQDAATFTAGSTTQGIFIDEGIEATDEDRTDFFWPAPYVLVTDLSVGCSTAIGIIYHDPK